MLLLLVVIYHFSVLYSAGFRLPVISFVTMILHGSCSSSIGGRHPLSCHLGAGLLQDLVNLVYQLATMFDFLQSFDTLTINLAEVLELGLKAVVFGAF